MEVGERLSLWVRNIFGKTSQPTPIVQKNTIPQKQPPVSEPTQIKPEAPVVALPAKKSREQREQEYKPQPKEPKVSPATVSVESRLPAQTTPEPTPEQRKKNLHQAFKEVVGTDTTLTLGAEQLPWLDGEYQIKLNLITLQGSDEKKFYYGSLVRGKDLVKAAMNLGQRKINANDALYAHLPEFVRSGNERYTRVLEFPSTQDKPIHCVAGKRDIRSYFMRFDGIHQFPVIIRIAACHKVDQGLVMKHISTVKQR